MRFISEYVQFPGRCMFSNSSDTSRGVLDTGLDIDVDGHVYMSGSLVEEAAGLLGWVHPEKMLELVNERDDLKRQVDELTLSIEAFDVLDKAVATVAHRIEAAKQVAAD